MIFKTIQSDLDGISNKLGFSKRSFAEWGKQVSTSFKKSEGIISSFQNAIKTALTVPIEKDDSWIKNKFGEIVSKDNIDSLIPKLTQKRASNLAQSIREQSLAVSDAKNGWDDYFTKLKSGGQDYVVDLIKNTDDLSKLTGEDLVQANQKAREAALAHNAALKQQTLGAKAAKVGMQALAMAGNMITMWAITKGLELAVKGIDELAHSTEHCKERVDELMSDYQSALNKANNNAKTVEDLASRYEKLSNGVNNLGENISLTADEYSEYNDIVNQIADMFPTLIQGYTNEGNAILSLKGNVEQLRDAYKEAQQEAYNMLIISGKDSDGNDIIKNWENLHGTDFFTELFDFGAADIGGKISTQEAIDQLKTLSNMSAEAYRNIEKITSSGTREEIASLTDIEKNIGYGSFIYKALGIDGNVTDEAFNEARKQAQALIQAYQAEINSGLKNVQTLANAYLMTNEDYDKFDDQSKTAASLLINSIDEEIANGFSSKADVGAYVIQIVNSIKDNTDVQDALINLFSLDPSKLSFDELQSEIDKYIQIIANYLHENPVDLKVRLGFDISQDRKDLRNKLSNGEQDLVVDDWIYSLTEDEAAIANSEAFYQTLERQKQGLDGAALSADNYSAALEEVMAQQDGLGTDKHPISFDQAWADSFTSENDAVKELGSNLLELAEQGRLTIETFNNADSTAGGYFKNLGISADEAVSKINKLVDESKQLSSMSGQISAMTEALGTKLENGYVGADTLSGFDVEVRGLDSWDRFQEVLGSTTSSYEECQEAANALATEWVNSSDFLAQLTEQNEEYYKTQLEAMGIENYKEVISYAQALNEAKEALSQSSLELGNATYDEIEALVAEGQYSELTANMILALYDAKIAEQAAAIDTSADCANLIALAGDTDRTSQSIQLLIQLMDIYSGLESGAYNGNRLLREEALGEVNRIKGELEKLANGETKKIEFEPTVKLGNRGKSSAKSAGKSAGKSFKDGLKEELSDLDSVISGITSRIDDQISSVNEQKSAALESIDEQKEALEEAKDAAVDALEAERDARLEVIEAEKEQLEGKIKLIDKQIESKQDEIDAINEAAEARKRELDLQKAQYELERMQNQRTKLVDYMPDTIVI